jgi:hypothetical protein
MLDHSETAASATNAVTAISHSSIGTGIGGITVGSGVVAVGAINDHLEAAHEIGWWFTHTGLFHLITYSQICQLVGTFWVLFCASNLAYKSIKKRRR